jgi:hypothetical protein
MGKIAGPERVTFRRGLDQIPRLAIARPPRGLAMPRVAGSRALLVLTCDYVLEVLLDVRTAHAGIGLQQERPFELRVDARLSPHRRQRHLGVRSSGAGLRSGR